MLIPQAQITLNLLRTSHIYKNLSIHAVLNGHFDFIKHPMAPLGTKIVVHVKPTKRAAWGYHGDDGFYVEPELEHYRCVQYLMKNSRHIRISDTVQFFPNSTPFPKSSLSDRLYKALDEIISALASPHFCKDNPTLKFDEQTILAIQIIANMLHRMMPKPPLPPPIPISPNIKKATTHKIPPPQHPTPVPRVVLTMSRHPHTILKQKANSHIQVQPIAKTLIQRLLYIYNKQTGKKEFLKSLLNNHLTGPIWKKASSNEYGRLMNGNDTEVLGTNTM